MSKNTKKNNEKKIVEVRKHLEKSIEMLQEIELEEELFSYSEKTKSKKVQAIKNVYLRQFFDENNDILFYELVFQNYLPRSYHSNFVFPEEKKLLNKLVNGLADKAKPKIQKFDRNILIANVFCENLSISIDPQNGNYHPVLDAMQPKLIKNDNAETINPLIINTYEVKEKDDSGLTIIWGDFNRKEEILNHCLKQKRTSVTD